MYRQRIGIASSLLFSIVCLGCALSSPSQYPTTSRELQVLNDDSGSGTKDEADAYYTKLEQTLHIDKSWGLDRVLRYYGYDTLLAKEIETKSSMDLMNSKQFGSGDILSTVYFAPKISDVAFAEEYASIGWRKLVRLKARSGSDASQNNLTAIYLLFNFFAEGSAQANEDPMSNGSSNTQAILVHSNGSADYLDFDGQNSLYHRSDHLNASFDARDPNQLNQGQKNPYYVPVACNLCHACATNGQSELNFVDTDYFIDRVQPGNDYADLRKGRYAVLTDGGKIKSDGGTRTMTPQYKKAFKIVKIVNAEVMAQNAATDTSSENLQYSLSKNWLNHHKQVLGYLKPVDRAIPSHPFWSSKNVNDVALVNDLVRYCYRCHGTVNYTVYDKSIVKEKAKTMEIMLGSSMPKDRKLDATTIKKLSNELETLRKSR